jgi:hypothetical protein
MISSGESLLVLLLKNGGFYKINKRSSVTGL